MMGWLLFQCFTLTWEGLKRSLPAQPHKFQTSKLGMFAVFWVWVKSEYESRDVDFWLKWIPEESLSLQFTAITTRRGVLRFYLRNLRTRTRKQTWQEPTVLDMKGCNTDQMCVVTARGFGRCAVVIWKINQLRINKQVPLAEDHSAPPARANVTETQCYCRWEVFFHFLF